MALPKPIYSKDRTCRIEIRLTPEERHFFEEQAKEANLTVSEFTRRRAKGKRLISRLDSQTLSEVRRLGGLQKHLATVYPAQREMFGEVLGEIIALLRRMG